MTTAVYPTPAQAVDADNTPLSTARPAPDKFQKQIAGRLHAAKVNGGAAVAEPRGNGRYTVTGRVGTRYTVHVVSLETIVCDCKAGQYGNYACWHAAAAYLRHIADHAMATS